LFGYWARRVATSVLTNSDRELRSLEYRNAFAPPVEARMCANTMREVRCPASSRRFRSFQAGSMLRNMPGCRPSPCQPSPKPSPLVVVAPIVECTLSSISECLGLTISSSIRTGDPE